MKLIKSVCKTFLSGAAAAVTFALRTGGAAEGAVLVLYEMATENDVLASFGVFTAHPEGGQDHLVETKSRPHSHIIWIQFPQSGSYLVVPSLM